MYEVDTATIFTKIYITIEYWEWAIALNIFILLLIIGFRKKLLYEPTQPEYRYYILGFYAKIIGILGFVLYHFYVLEGGDTLRYFESSISMANLFYKNPGAYFEVMFSSNTDEVRSLFDFFTGFPYQYIYNDMNTFWVVKLISPITIITGKSYLLTSIILGYFSFLGIWKAFQLFYRKFPHLEFQMALCFLFIPTVTFYGSGILKDIFTLTATCLFIVHFHKIFIEKYPSVSSYLTLIISSFLILGIKPYIFMILLPVVLVWYSYGKLQKLQSSKLSFLLYPLVIAAILGFSYLFFSSISSSMDKFSVNNALTTASVTHTDLKQDYYEGQSFDIGNFDGTITGALKLMPFAIFAGLFRPFIWEADSPFLLVSALENIFLMYLFFRLFFYGSLGRLKKVITGDPIILFCLIFGILFAYMLGITTSNFGALIRFKIPMLPFFAAGLFIANYNMKRRKYFDPKFNEG